MHFGKSTENLKSGALQSGKSETDYIF